MLIIQHSVFSSLLIYMKRCFPLLSYSRQKHFMQLQAVVLLFWWCCFRGITKPCTHLNSDPSTSTQLHPSHFNVHPPPPTSTQFISASTQLCNTLIVIRTKISHVNGQFRKIYAKNFKVAYFDWKLEHMVYWRHWFRIET